MCQDLYFSDSGSLLKIYNDVLWIQTISENKEHRHLAMLVLWAELTDAVIILINSPSLLNSLLTFSG